MISALVLALADPFAPALRRILWLCLALALASFAVLWTIVAFALAHIALFGWRPLDWIVDLLGVFAVLGLSWLLFPAVVTLVIGLFLERIAVAVESLHYPGRGPSRRAPIGETLRATVRLMGLAILVNLLALPVYVLMPGINFFVFLGLNGYLFGREYFEAVALRRFDLTATQAMRRRFAWRVFLGGVVVAALFAVPVVNLIAPVIATALMVHFVESLRSTDAALPAE